MPLITQINPINDIRYVDNFEILYKVALSLKAQHYFADPMSRTIYGFYSDYHSILETALPCEINNPLFFYGSVFTPKVKEYISKFPNHYFYSASQPFFLFPENRINDYLTGKLYFNYGDKVEKINHHIFTKGFSAFDENIAEDCLVLADPDEWYLSNRYINTINAYRRRLSFLNKPFIIKNFHTNPIVQVVLSNKITIGTKVVSISEFDEPYGYKPIRPYTFYIFKNLIHHYFN